MSLRNIFATVRLASHIWTVLTIGCQIPRVFDQIHAAKFRKRYLQTFRYFGTGKNCLFCNPSTLFFMIDKTMLSLGKPGWSVTVPTTELNSLCRISSNHSPPSPCHYTDHEMTEIRMRSSLVRMRSSLVRMRSSLVRMRSSLVVRASDCQCMHQLQRSWFRSQHPSAQWNLRGGRWSSAEYSTKKI